MSDEALANAFAELRSLQDRQREIDAQIVAMNQSRASVGERIKKAAEFILVWHTFAGKPVPKMEAVLTTYRTSEGVMYSPMPLKVTGNPKKDVVAAAAVDIALELNRPVPRPELYRILKERGLEVRGIDPLVTLSTMLWRMKDRIVHIPGRGYWPANVRYVEQEAEDVGEPDHPKIDPEEKASEELFG